MGGSVSSLFDPDDDRSIVVPDGYVIPPFPSLYLPSFDNTQGEVGIFLYEAESIWHFTLYWTLLLIGGTFFLCSLWASINLFFSLTTLRSKTSPPSLSEKSRPTNTPPRPHTNSDARSKKPQIRRKRPRPPLWILLLLPIVMSFVAALVALISGSVIGFALAAVYSAGGFTMSTWVPFLWALIQVIVLIISSYSTLTSIL